LTDRQGIRKAIVDDAASIRSLALDTGLFAPDEMGDFDEALSGYFDGTLDSHRWIVSADVFGDVVGAAYYAPEPFADRLWNLYFLAVRPGVQRGGIGRALIAHVEEDLQRQGDQVARVLIVETSSLETYARARALYEARGFEEEARIRDFYGPGDNKVIFWKSLQATPEERRND
jgi:ribosomal protein S18 acetylase RimI-like enzyme